MNQFGRLVQVLDKIKDCSEKTKGKVCLTSGECEDLCAYIWWLTKQIAKAREEEDAK